MGEFLRHPLVKVGTDKVFLKEQQKNIYKRLFGYAAPYKGWLALAMLASLGVGGSDAVIAYLVKPFVDELLVAGNIELARQVPVWVIALAAFKGIARYLQQYNLRSVGQAAIQDIRNQLYQHLVVQPLRFFTANSSASLMSRILNDVNVMQAALSDVLVTILREVVTMLALIGYAFYADWRMALMAFIVIPAAAVPAAALGKMIKKYSRRGQDAMGDLTAVIEQTLSGIKVIKAFGTEAEERKK
ncbi:MAG: ABC transporter permease, partial [Deltaproteobacteria bacterium]|nr:ABC transporter permease [Deltaproteobacteria bacterium]